MDVFEEIVELRRAGGRGALATIVSVRGSIPSYHGAKMLIREDGTIKGTIGGGCVEAEVWQAAREVMSNEVPRTLRFDLNQNPKYDTGLVCGGTLEIFIEPILPAAELMIFGAGHVGHELARCAHQAGFEIVVADDRAAYASAERFPMAREVMADEFDRIFAGVKPNTSTSIVVVTRGHHDDMRVLRWALGTQASYIGMMGSKRKAIEIFRELTAEGIPAERFQRVYSPIGLDIAAVTPAEIAVSIAAELIAHRRRAERPLAHMSWFQSARGISAAAAAPTTVPEPVPASGSTSANPSNPPETS